MFAVLAAMAVPLTAAACSSSDGADGSTTSVSITEPTATPSTSAATPTTTAGTETTTGSTTVEDAIRAAHTRVMTELFARDERVQGPEAMLPLAEELTTGPLLKRIRDDVESKQRSGERSVNPGYDSHIVDVTILADDHARVLDCSQDRGARYSAGGQLLIPADDFYKLRESDMILLDGRWVATDVFAGGEERCTPEP